MTSKGYELLLAQLAENNAQAAEEYQILRRKIIYKFIREDRGRWNPDHEFLADDVLSRTAEYLEAGKIAEKGVRALALGIAKIVWLTYIRKNPLPVDAESAPETSYQPEVEEESEDARLACLRKCLIEICKNDEERKNLLDYYRQSDNKLLEQRKSIAARLGISTNTLKTRMSRLRDKLRECVSECFKKQQTA